MDAIVPEPAEGAQTDPQGVAANLRTAIVDSLSELVALPADELLAARYDRFRAFGAPGRQPTLSPIEDGT